MTVKVLSDFTGYGGRRVAIVTVDGNGDVTGWADPLVIQRRAPDPQVMGAGIADTMAGPFAEEFLQSALEEAWRVGLRPKNWQNETTAQVAAMDNHLQDMRRIVFAEIPPIIKST